MRKFTSLLVLNLMLGSAACELSTGEDDADPDGGTAAATGRGDAGGRGTAVNPNNPSGSVTNDAGTASTTTDAQTTSTDVSAPTAGDAATSVTPPTTTTAPEQCAPLLPTASSACGAPDAFEPNDTKSAALTVDTSSGCAVVPAKLSSHSDEDWYLFSSPKSDPVQVQVAYETDATGGAKLSYRLYEATSSSYLLWRNGREDLKWTLSDATVIKKNIGYQVLVEDEGTLQGCQGYNLRVNTQYCTDAFEDNDDRSAAVAGISANTPLAATIFTGDDDWYDVTALQAQGATCTFTAELTATSTSSLEIKTYGASASYQQWRGLDGSTPSLTLTLPAGQTSLLYLSKSGPGCLPYTVLCKPL